MSKYIYVVEMCRWGSNENHSYFFGAYTTLKKALEEGIQHASFRGRKYEPYITMSELDTISVHNHMCRTLEEAQALYVEITGAEWVEPELTEAEEEPSNV